MAQAVALAGRHGGVQLQLFIDGGPALACLAGRQGFLHARAVAWRGRPGRLRQQLRQQLPGYVGIAEVGVEQFAEHGAVLGLSLIHI